MLLVFPVFEAFPVTFLLLISCLIPFGVSSCMYNFNSFKFVKIGCTLSIVVTVSCSPGKMCSLLLLGGMVYKCQLDPVG
jgi:hypothetical protein